jgi:hypothetical protein
MMTNRELDAHLYDLHLSSTEAAQLLGVASRTVRRWLEGEEVPGPAEAALRAWRKLATRRLPWRPDSVAVEQDDQDQIARHRAHAIDLSATLERVEARGGARVPWEVNRIGRTATLGPLQISYYDLSNGSFSLATYTRKDGAPDMDRDRELIEDAIYCIARERKKAPDFGPVTLVYFDQSWTKGAITPTLEEYKTNRDAIRRVAELWMLPKFQDPFIMVGNLDHYDLLWNKADLQSELDRRKKVPVALMAVADDVRGNSTMFVRNGPQMLTPAEAQRRKDHIELLSDEIRDLAKKATEDRNSISYNDFDNILQELHQVGFFPNSSLISGVAKALSGA